MPPLPGLPTKDMERMEVDQCAGAAGGAGGGALRRSNSAPMITGVRLVQLHPYSRQACLNKCLFFVFLICPFMHGQRNLQRTMLFIFRLF